MPRMYVVYEVWTTARLVEATDETDAYQKGEPPPREGMNLCNWHVVSLASQEAEQADKLRALLERRT